MKCRKCSVELVPLDNWNKSQVKAGSYICRDCHKSSLRANKKSIRNNYLKRTYGITIEDYNEMFESQGGCCDICGEHQSEFSRTFAVDHDHESGAIRSLLCGKCNRGIGYLGDDIATVREALNYLIRHSEEE